MNKTRKTKGEEKMGWKDEKSVLHSKAVIG
jgi:hypothetical protein